MKYNYHTHTYRCHHAYGTEREYVETAIERGLKGLGFSDHVPYPLPVMPKKPFRMSLEETTGYYRTIGELREEYAGEIDIYIGFEAEYYPKHFNDMIEHLEESAAKLASGKRVSCEYLILGQHFTFNEYDGQASGSETADERQLASYVENVAAAIETGKITYIAHPDLMRYTGDRHIYDRYMGEMIKCASLHNVPLEINLLGLHTGRHYPCGHFWELVADSEASVVMGCDAHDKGSVGNPQLIEEGHCFAKKFGLRVLDEIPLRPVFTTI